MVHWTEKLFQGKPDVFTEFADRSFQDAVDDVRNLIHLVEQTQGFGPTRILDVPCGTGRHVLAFASEGREAVGLDFSEKFIKQARERAAERGVEARAEFRVQDMRRLDELDGEYDLLTNFWNSLGYYDRATDVEILSELNRLRSDSGVVVIEMSNKEHLIRNYSSSVVRTWNGNLHVERKSYDSETGRFETTVDLFSETSDGYDYLDTLTFNPRIYAPVELRELCLDAGFTDVSMYGGFSGEDLTIQSERVVVIAS